MAPGLNGDGQPAPALAGELTPFEYRLMTKRQIAEYFGITERTIEVWMRRRYIPFIKIGQTVRFRVASVLRYVDEKYLVPAGEGGRRRKNRGKPSCCGGGGPNAAGAPFHRDPPCDASGTPAA
jgi:excisionase family DNA binding protein